MKHFGQFFLLLASLSLFINPLRATNAFVGSCENKCEIHQEKHWSAPQTYDAVLQLLDDLESGDLESRYSLSSLERINSYLATLAQEGFFPNEKDKEIAFNEDTLELLFGEESALYLAHTIEEAYEYSFIPAIATNYEEIDILYCGAISHSWKKTKKFVRNHKKEIIIGAAIVAGGSIAAAILLGGSSATTFAAGAIATGSTLSNSSVEPEHPKKVHESPSLSFFNDDSPEKSTFDQNAYAFKKSLHEDPFTISVENEPSFREKVREAGGNFAHQTFDEIMDLTKAVPQFCEEIKEFGTKFVPNGPSITDSKFAGKPIDHFENLVAKGHHAIDKAFSTDQADHFTPEAKANDPSYSFDIGLLPPPGNFSNGIRTSKFRKMVEAGKETTTLAGELGFTTKEIVELEKAGKLERAVLARLEVAQSESEVLQTAVRNNRHVKMVKNYLNKPGKEIQKGISSYEKQIAIHKDKIANPTKHYPDWDKLDSRQRKALINKKWPAEIKGFEEQKDVLQSILKERLSYE